ncbi:MAG: hypothetical protein HGA39_06015 [Coriobacteriia bacterium]|nr:hypothetical protein [Coriobacteriia bacterium]
MELALQFGYGMMAHTRSLIEAWGGGTVVLSPRDMTDAQLTQLASDVCSIGGQPLLDPQFYLPHADHARLQSHDYWPSEFEESHVLNPAEWRTLLGRLASLQNRIGCGRVILPGILADSPSEIDRWIGQQEILVQEADSLGILGQNTMLTIALSDSTVMSNEVVDEVLAHIRAIDVGWIYLVVQHPGGQYLVDDPVWLGNVLDLTAGIRLLGKHVLVGYCQHQMLALASAGADAIASGTWMNVRSFPPEKFQAAYEEEIRKRKTWFYSPEALSEYGLPYLDVASKGSVLELLRPGGDYPKEGVDRLFTAPQPSAVKFSESEAFRHYLSCLRLQVAASSKDTFDATFENLESWIAESERRVALLAAAGVRGQGREFNQDVSQATIAALRGLRADRGAILRRSWSSITGAEGS